MDLHNYYQILNLPAMPDDMVAECINVIKERSAKILYTDKFYYSKVKTLDGKEVSGSAYIRFEIPTRIKKWIEENIKPTNTSGIPDGIQCFWSDKDLFSYAAHVDGKRGRVILYNLDTGGESVETTWFKEKDKPLFRKFDKSDFYNSITDLTSIDKICSIIVKKQEWAIIETRIIHSITNMTRPRITLAIGVSDSDVDSFCKFHKIDTTMSNIWKEI